MKNPLKEMVSKRQKGIHCGIPSFCCANKIVIEAIMEQALRFGDNPLIEATSNQVNQDGGYMNMTPMDFTNYVYSIADKLGIFHENIIIGGDHMGPLPWVEMPADIAMENAKELVKQCVKAGYKKIHLDTSMRLGDDSLTERLSDDIIAERGVILYKACEEAYQEMLMENPNVVHPVFVIGSEVPIPGGAQDNEICQVTKPEDFEAMILAYRNKFKEYNMENAWDNIIAVVVQPGVEFGDKDIHHYDRNDAKQLCEALKNYPDIVFEGHSTDYQTPTKLKEMVQDGIAIIKVGPALTFSLREALFALEMMEKELIEDETQRSNFQEVLEKEMLENSKNWEKYYFGTEQDKYIARKYSYSDRSRYYMSKPMVLKAQDILFKNIDSVDIPMCMLRQYMPIQYVKVMEGTLSLNAKALVKDSVVNLVEDYNYAVKSKYVIGSIFIN